MRGSPGPQPAPAVPTSAPEAQYHHHPEQHSSDPAFVRTTRNRRPTLRRPSLPPMPDLSHLTEDERKVIEDVLRRQREEEEKEQEVIR
ncbi:hypothetical protein ACOMHN_011096 [Nucella lapillus]